MTIKYGIYNFEFDTVKWAALISRALSGIDRAVLAEMLNVSESALYNWSIGRVDHNFPHPNMSNFIRICNMLDVDPRDFFVIGG